MTDDRRLFWNMTLQVKSTYLLDQREKDLSHVAETVLLAAVKHVSGAAQSSHFVHQTLLTTLL